MAQKMELCVVLGSESGKMEADVDYNWMMMVCYGGLDLWSKKFQKVSLLEYF